jgi:hypothetical protein
MLFLLLLLQQQLDKLYFLKLDLKVLPKLRHLMLRQGLNYDNRLHLRHLNHFRLHRLLLHLQQSHTVLMLYRVL